MNKNNIFQIVSFFTCMMVSPLSDAVAQSVSNAPVDLQADRLEHDKSGQSVTATGDVVLIQEGKTVKADKIVYNFTQDTVVATGAVEFIDGNGDKHYAERVEFNDALKNGFVEGLQTFLVDGSRFKAANGRHEGGTKTIMKDASYTPCKSCKDTPEKDPAWQIRASKVFHDQDAQTISYNNARFEVAGVPVLYLPYFEHPDGSVKRKSGFLTPSAGYTSDLGAFVQSQYYWSIAPNKDLTAGLQFMTQEAPLGLVEYRQRWNDASLRVNASTTYSERSDREAGVNVVRNEKFRGNIKAEGLWDIDEKWRGAAKIDLVSDKQYLRQYDLDDEDVLENEVYVERFSGRNYARGGILAFQDVRVDPDLDEDQPHILPEIEAFFVGEPDSVPVVGGRWSAKTSLLGLVRDKNEQDVNRIHGALGWNKRLISETGLVSSFDVGVENTLYYVNDRTGVSDSSTELRSFGYVNAKTSYPMVKDYKGADLMLEPIASLTLSPNISEDDIPNEDSQDVQIDALNLFEANRFPGTDGIEDKSHVTYGVRSGLYAGDGSQVEAFIGQSYRFDDENNPFGKGSGLDEQQSDIVGQVSGQYKDNYRLNYRFQLDNNNLSSERHEVDASLKLGKLNLSTQYLYAKALDGTDIDETREQVTNAASYYINDQWRISGGARHDLGDDAGLRAASLSVNYSGQCVSFSVVGQRTLTDDFSGDSGTELFLRLGLRNLGEFETSGIQLGRQSE